MEFSPTPALGLARLTWMAVGSIVPVVLAHVKAVRFNVWGLALAAIALAIPAIARADPATQPMLPEVVAVLKDSPSPSSAPTESTWSWGGLISVTSHSEPERTDLAGGAVDDDWREIFEVPPAERERIREAVDAMCAETEHLLHDDPLNLGKSESELRAELQARGCDPSVTQTQKQSTDFPKYAAYPYAAGTAGYVLRRIPYWWTSPGLPRAFSGQIAAEGAHGGRHVWGGGGHFRGSMWRLGVETGHSFHVDSSAKRGLYHGDAHFVVAPVLRPRAVLWIGMGAVWADQQFPRERRPGAANEAFRAHEPEPDATGPWRRERGQGISGTASLDLFPVRPVVVSGRIDAGQFVKGSLAGSRTLRARLTVGYMLRRFEFYGGYEAKRIGQQSQRGPVLGLRTWF